MNILVAFDKFKDSMTAAVACKAAAAGIKAAIGTGKSAVTEAQLTDGGEGFCSILTLSAKGRIEFHEVCGPLGTQVQAPLGWVSADHLPAVTREQLSIPSGKLAIIEMAAAAGLEQVPDDQRHPANCTTYGVGELIQAAITQKADAILIGIGGSATSDLGLGALEALGLQYMTAEGTIVPQLKPKEWPRIKTISGTIETDLPPIYIACDVDNPLLGPQGAAAVYGPQKGLSPDEYPAYDREAERMSAKLCQYFTQSQSLRDEAGSGAAGGIGFGLKAAFNARFIPGFQLVTDWLELEQKIAEADLIISGEGKFDQSSLNGKGPYAIAESAHKKGKQSILLAGALDPKAAKTLSTRFPNCSVAKITPDATPLQQALAEAPQNLEQAARTAIQQLLTNDR